MARLSPTARVSSFPWAVLFLVIVMTSLSKHARSQERSSASTERDSIELIIRQLREDAHGKFKIAREVIARKWREIDQWAQSKGGWESLSSAELKLLRERIEVLARETEGIVQATGDDIVQRLAKVEKALLTAGGSGKFGGPEEFPARGSRIENVISFDSFRAGKIKAFRGQFTIDRPIASGGFEAIVDVQPDGSFEGTMKDEDGRAAKVAGNLGDQITFTKTYLDPPVAEFAYNGRVELEADGFCLTGTWRGVGRTGRWWMRPSMNLLAAFPEDMNQRLSHGGWEGQWAGLWEELGLELVRRPFLMTLKQDKDGLSGFVEDRSGKLANVIASFRWVPCPGRDSHYNGRCDGKYQDIRMTWKLPAGEVVEFVGRLSQDILEFKYGNVARGTWKQVTVGLNTGKTPMARSGTWLIWPIK